ncbi:MAG: hypothetical protein Tsb0033_13730 [Winogradskyella sp.]
MLGLFIQMFPKESQKSLILSQETAIFIRFIQNLRVYTYDEIKKYNCSSGSGVSCYSLQR